MFVWQLLLLLAVGTLVSVGPRLAPLVLLAASAQNRCHLARMVGRQGPTAARCGVCARPRRCPADSVVLYCDRGSDCNPFGGSCSGPGRGGDRAIWIARSPTRPFTRLPQADSVDHWRSLAQQREADLKALQDEWKEMTESTAELEKTLLAEIEAVRSPNHRSACLVGARIGPPPPPFL
jgi:hypothetical protein